MIANPKLATIWQQNFGLRFVDRQMATISWCQKPGARAAPAVHLLRLLRMIS
jgi:hypothetical protein